MADHTELLKSPRPSDIIDISRLEKENQSLLYVGLLLAFVIHPVIGSYFMFKKSDETITQAYPVKFSVTSTRNTKPLELKPKKVSLRIIQRGQLYIKQPVARLETKMDYSLEIREPVDKLALETSVENSAEINEKEQKQAETDVPISSELNNRISMKNELISVVDFDTGRYKAMVVHDPSTMDIRGFIYMASTWGSQLRVPDNLKRAVINLAEAVTRYTGIEAKVDSHLLLNSRDIFNVPFIYITTEKVFEITPDERLNLEEYLHSGGFAVFDNNEPSFDCSQAESSLRKMIRDVLGSGIRFVPIPNDHPIYHCFFHFDDGPPQGSEIKMFMTTTSGRYGEAARNSAIGKPVHYLEGIWIDGRLVAVYSNKGYGAKWKDNDNNDPQLKMGVNMVVYALTQEGGIAQKTMSHYFNVQ
ncbi:DUF4159 domain-containing protein [bacterium]|nr:DUF4159 domain-containing protein [bacterium]